MAIYMYLLQTKDNLCSVGGGGGTKGHCVCERKFGGVSNGVSLVSTFLVVYPLRCLNVWNITI